MNQRYCSACDNPLKYADITPVEGVTQCSSCGSVKWHVVHDVTSGKISRGASVLGGLWREIPAGCKVTGKPGDITLSATNYTRRGVMEWLIFTLVSGCCISPWVFILITFFYTCIFGPGGGWAKGSVLDVGEDVTLGTCVFWLVFLTPFMLAVTSCFVMTLVNIFGDVKLRVQGNSVSVGTGIGPFRWTRYFKKSQVRDVHLGLALWRWRHRVIASVVVEASTNFRFGCLLSGRRLRWLASATCLLLLDPEGENVSELLADL